MKACGAGMRTLSCVQKSIGSCDLEPALPKLPVCSHDVTTRSGYASAICKGKGKHRVSGQADRLGVRKRAVWSITRNPSAGAWQQKRKGKTTHQDKMRMGEISQETRTGKIHEASPFP